MARKGKDAFAEALVGLFMVAVVALLAYFTIVISGVDVLSGRSKVRVRVVFDQVGGLKTHDSVMYRGTKVGKVSGIAVTPTNLVVTADIDPNVVLRSRCRITVCNLSMLGGNYLLLDEGDGDVVDIMAETFVGETPTDWMRDLSDVTRNFRELSEMTSIKSIVTNVEAVSVSARSFMAKANEVAEKADEVAAAARDVVTRVERGEGTLGKLFSKEDALYHDLTNTVANASAISTRVRNGEGTVGRLLMSDDELYANLKDAVAKFRDASATLDFTETKADAREVLERAKTLFANLEEVSGRLKRGEGTMGKLLAEDGLYKEVDGLMRDCRQIIDNYRDTTPISTFSSLAAGAL